jgi:hypothetical protein
MKSLVESLGSNKSQKCSKTTLMDCLLMNGTCVRKSIEKNPRITPHLCLVKNPSRSPSKRNLNLNLKDARLVMRKHYLMMLKPR